MLFWGINSQEVRCPNRFGWGTSGRKNLKKSDFSSV